MKAPFLTAAYKEKRFFMARSHGTWSNNAWTIAMFSDKNRFILGAPDGVELNWHSLRHKETVFSSEKGGMPES